MVCLGLWPVVLVLATCVPVDRAVIGEILYDADGSDSGREFVELFNPTPHRVDLGGLRLESGDGAGVGRWTLQWTAAAGLGMEPGDRFVIGGALVTPVVQATVELSLQNGPDAVRLVWPDGTIEVAGYGALSPGEYFCGHPAADAAPGLSLARVPDRAQSGDNALDFRPATPSPGGANQSRRHAAWVRGALALEPQQPAPGGRVRLVGRVINAGADSIAAGALAVRVALSRAAGDDSLACLSVTRPLASGESVTVAIDATAPEAGVHVWTATLELVGDESPAGTRDSLRARTGPGALELTEIQFHPAWGEGEWVEARNRSGGSVDLTDWTLRDRGGTNGRVLFAAPLAPDSLVVLAQSREALSAAYPGLDTARVVTIQPWPNFNNRDDASGTADALEVSDAEDLPADHAAYSALGVPAGVPVERDQDGRWRPALDPLGTPLARSHPPAEIRGSFALLRARLAPGEPATRVAWALPWRESRIRIDAYGLRGDHAGVLLAETPVAARGERDLPASALGPGLYVLVLEAHPGSGAGALQATQLLRVDGVAP